MLHGWGHALKRGQSFSRFPPTYCLWDRWLIGWLFWRKVALKLALSFGLLAEGFSFIDVLDTYWCPRLWWEKVLGTFLDSACRVWLHLFVTPGNHSISIRTISLSLWKVLVVVIYSVGEIKI